MEFISKDNRYKIQINRHDDPSFTLSFKDKITDIIFEKRIFEEEIHHSIEQFVFFIQKCFLLKDDFIYDIHIFEDIHSIHPFQSLKILFTHKTYQYLIQLHEKKIFTLVDDEKDLKIMELEKRLELKNEEFERSCALYEDLLSKMLNLETNKSIKNIAISCKEVEIPLENITESNISTIHCVLDKNEFNNILNDRKIQKLRHISTDYLLEFCKDKRSFIRDTNDFIVIYSRKTIFDNLFYYFITKKGLIFFFIEQNLKDNTLPFLICSKHDLVNIDIIEYINKKERSYFSGKICSSHGYDIKEYIKKFYFDILIKLWD